MVVGDIMWQDPRPPPEISSRARKLNIVLSAITRSLIMCLLIFPNTGSEIKCVQIQKLEIYPR